MEELFTLIDGTSKRRGLPWYRRWFVRPEDKSKFSGSELKEIRGAVAEQLGLAEPWISINGRRFPKAGRIFKLKPETRYRLISPGRLVFVMRVDIERRLFLEPEAEGEVLVQPLYSDGGINTQEVLPVIRICDLEPASEGEINNLLENRQKPKAIEDILFDGEAVELAEDVIFAAEDQMGGGAASQRFPKGLRGIIDSPDIMQGMSLDEINFSYERKRKIKIQAGLSLVSGRKTHQLQNDIFEGAMARQGDHYKVYIPAHKADIEFSRSQLHRHVFDKEMFDKVAMDKDTREDILSLVFSKEETLNQWGIKESFKKGKGKIVLAFGPSGTGKTMTAEALAELLGRPLFIADSTELGYDPITFERSFKKIIEKTERWNSVTLIDEAEGILRSRDSGYNSDARVEAVLRHLEKLERGIIWFTTNRPPDIDSAIDSRIRKKLNFPKLDAEKRKKVWQTAIPSKMFLSGSIEPHLDQLAAIDINGREIGNAINNAADRASYEGLEAVPVEYLAVAAKTIFKNQKILDEAKVSIGFNIKKPRP